MDNRERAAKIITCHMGADFDSLAAMVAVKKLYREGIMCFSGSASRGVREFLSRYESRLSVSTPKHVNTAEADTLIVVDARSLRRIGPFAELATSGNVRVHVFDHHPPVTDEIPAHFSMIEPTGAVTTMLVEAIIEHRVPISPFEATLFAIGIYEDTGSLTFGSCGEREYKAVSNLRSMGADMASVPVWMESSLTWAERELLNSMTDNSYEKYISGARVVFCALTHPVYVDGISLFAHRLRDLCDADVVVTVVNMEKRTLVAAKSRDGVMDCARLLSHFGGGGHPLSASLSVPQRDTEELVRELEARVSELIQPQLEVSRIMSSPVMAIDRAQTVDQAYRLMLRYGHSALPVMEDHRMCGLITRKDLDKAQLHGMGGALVADFMTAHVTSVAPDAPIEEAHRIMVSMNVGRLPVLSDCHLTGIVTRTDILRALYPASLPPGERTPGQSLPWTEDVSERMKYELPDKAMRALRELGEHGEELGMKVYAVGGVVRDFMAGRSSFDIDIVIEGDGVRYLESFKGTGVRVAIHSRYKTGTLTYDDGWKIDIATARREFYEYPVAMPTVSSDSLTHDLYRRDFSVNAMAIALCPGEWGELVDYFGGRSDLRDKTLRVLHNLSFVEDPTRVLRGIRLEQRLDFKMSYDTQRLAVNCVKGGLLGLLSGPRLRNEIELMLGERNVPGIMGRMDELGVIEAAMGGVRPGQRAWAAVRRCAFFINRMGRDMMNTGRRTWLAYLGALMADSSVWTREMCMNCLALTSSERMDIVRALDGVASAEQDIGVRGELPMSRIYAYAREVPPHCLLLIAAVTDRWRVRRRILLYMTRLFRTVPMLTGGDVMDLGCPKGPEVGHILAQLRYARLDGEVDTREDEEEWVKSQITQTNAAL